MSVLVQYDLTGYITDQKQGSNLREPVGIPFLWVQIPEGKKLVRIDVSVTPNIPIFEDSPKTEVQLLHEQVDDLNVAIAALIGGAE